MTRDEFADGFAQRLRNVLQKFEREAIARAQQSHPGPSIALGVANTNLDAAIAEMADFVLDAVANTRDWPVHGGSHAA
jgi:hypothetical protein